MFSKENGFTLPINLNFPDAKKYIFTFISLLIILIAVYSNSFHGEWHFDDFANIVNNPYIQIKSFSWEEIKQCIYGLEQKRLSRPLSYLSFALNYQFSGSDVFGYHLVNFVIHYLAAVFLFLFIYNTLRLPLIKDRYKKIAYPVAMLSTFFWAINPVHVTSVTYIVQRMTSMAALFYIMSMYFYLKARTDSKLSHSIIFFIFSILSVIAAVLTKENAAMLPVSILLYDLFLIQGFNKYNLKKYLRIALLPLAVILIIGFIYADFSAIWEDYKIRDFTMAQRVLTEPRIIIFYLSLLFYPINSRLTLLYDTNVSLSLFQPWTTIPAILLIIFIIGFALYIAKKRPLISFCLIFYFLNHIIEGSIFSLELIYEHRNYLPSMFLFILPAEFCIFVLNYFSYKKLIQYAVTFGIIIILFGLGDSTYRRNEIVSNDDKLWLDNINKYPNVSRTHSNLGNTYVYYQLKAKGLQEYEKAMSLNNFANIYARALQEHNLGLYYFNKREYDKALPYFESSSRVLNDYLPNKIQISKIKLLNNQTNQAHFLIEKELKQYPTNLELLEFFSLILFKEGKYNAAEKFARKALQINISRTFPLMVLAELSRRRGNHQSAINLWTLYQKSYPLNLSANLALIELYTQTNNKKMLNEELAKLYCYKETKTMRNYINEILQDKNIQIYVPDVNKIIAIVRKNADFK